MASYLQIDFHEERGQKPVFKKFEIIDESELQSGSLQYKNIKLKQNRVSTYDGGWLKQDIWPTYEGTFFDIGRVISQKRRRSVTNPNMLL